MICPLSTLRPGREAVVRIIRLPTAEVSALARLGLGPGTGIRLLRTCPFGGPGVYEFRAMALALRRETAEGILVTRKEPETGKKEGPDRGL